MPNLSTHTAFPPPVHTPTDFPRVFLASYVKGYAGYASYASYASYAIYASYGSYATYGNYTRAGDL